MRLPVNHHVFRMLSSESAYWIGFLAADGCVEANGRVRIVLKSSDVGHLKKFYAFVGCPSHRIYRNGPTCNCACIYSKDIVKSLVRYGVVPRKNWNRRSIHPRVAKLRAFWLGLFDGDGCLTRHRSYKNGRPAPSLRFYGNKLLMKQAARMLSRFGESPGVRPHGSIWYVSVTGTRALRTLSWMYRGARIFLPRKRDLFVKALGWKALPGGKPPSPVRYSPCEYCGKTVGKKPWQLRRAKRLLCGSKCWYRLRRTSNISTKPRLERLKGPCAFCGTPVEKLPSAFKGVFSCNRSCWLAFVRMGA